MNLFLSLIFLPSRHGGVDVTLYFLRWMQKSRLRTHAQFSLFPVWFIRCCFQSYHRYSGADCSHATEYQMRFDALNVASYDNADINTSWSHYLTEDNVLFLSTEFHSWTRRLFERESSSAVTSTFTVNPLIWFYFTKNFVSRFLPHPRFNLRTFLHLFFIFPQLEKIYRKERKRWTKINHIQCRKMKKI